jgi:hypothetical protein
MTSLVHNVLVEWNADAPTDAGARASELVDAHLRGLSGVVSIHRGPSVSPEGLEGRSEWGMTILFDGAAARDAYLPHPEHLVVAEYLRAHAAGVVVFDILEGSGA